MTRPSVALLMVHGVGRAVEQSLIGGAEKRVERWQHLFRCTISVEPFIWSHYTDDILTDAGDYDNETEKAEKEDSSVLDGATELQEAIKNTAHLPTRIDPDGGRIAPRLVATLWRLSGGLLDSALAIAATGALWAAFFWSPAEGWWEWSKWAATTAIITMLSLAVFSFLIAPFGSKIGNLRRSALLVAWPLFFGLASLPTLFFLALVPFFGWALNVGFENFWPANIVWQDGLPLAMYRLRFLGLIAALLILLSGLAVFGWIGRRISKNFTAFSRLIGDVFFYLGNAEHRYRAQRALYDRIDGLGQKNDFLVIGAHSLGSVLAVDTIRRFGLGRGTARVILITGGSPLKRIFHRFFGALYPAPRDIRGALIRIEPRFSWFNIFRPRDPVGGALLLDETADINTQQRYRGGRAHLHYFLDRRILVACARRAVVEFRKPIRTVDVSSVRERIAEYSESRFRLPDFVTGLRRHEKAAWTFAAVIGFVLWGILTDSVNRHRTLTFLDGDTQIVADGTLFGRRKWVSGGSDMPDYVVPEFWVEFTPSGATESICTSVSSSIETDDILDEFFAGWHEDSSEHTLSSCAQGRRNPALRSRLGRATLAPVRYSTRRPEKATIPGFEVGVWRWLGWLYKALFTILPLSVVFNVARIALTNKEPPPEDEPGE